MRDPLQEALEIAHEATAIALGIRGWEYRDFPNMLPEYWQLLEDFIGKENLHVWICSSRVWPDGQETIRGQVFISPQGLINLSENSKKYYEENEAHG